MPACITPFTVKNKRDQSIPVPCGKCPNCLKKRTSGWSFRLMQEEKRALFAYFVTFTYDTSTVPITRNGFMSLSKPDLQKFFKRLRKVSTRNVKIIYYAVGEYGGKFKRPHYHVILFNASLDKLIGDKLATQVRLGNIPLDGKQPFLSTLWPKGHITIGQVSGASVGYTLQYISDPWKPMHRNDDRVPQYAVMSKGIGENYLTPEMINWHKADLQNRMHLNLTDGKKCTMPRYLKDKLYDQLFDDPIERKRVRSDIGIVQRIEMINQEEERFNAEVDRKGFVQATLDQISSDFALFERSEFKKRQVKKSI